MENQPARQAEQRRTPRPDRLRRWDALALLALVVAFLIIAWTLIIGTHFGLNALSGQVIDTGPSNFMWSGQAALSSQTAQQAFVSGVTLTPCIGGLTTPSAFGAPARSTTITWLFNSSGYGLAHIQATCDPPARSLDHVLWLFVLQRDLTDSAHEWTTNGGGGFVLGPESIAQATPTWLPLPADTYTEQPVGGPSYASVALWEGQTHFFVLGHVADQAIRPAGATSIAVNGHAGWLTTANGLTTVTAVLPDSSTLFFSGTAAPAAAQSLAAAAFAHENEALQPLA